VSEYIAQKWLAAVRGDCILEPRTMGTRNTMAMALSTMLMKDRKRVIERMFSKAFHALAFFKGLPDQISRITKTQRKSMTIVITVNMATYLEGSETAKQGLAHSKKSRKRLRRLD